MAALLRNNKLTIRGNPQHLLLTSLPDGLQLAAPLLGNTDLGVILRHTPCNDPHRQGPQTLPADGILRRSGPISFFFFRFKKAALGNYIDKLLPVLLSYLTIQELIF
ncbi:hypothetical protein D3C73_1383620 [compost metagenome]